MLPQQMSGSNKCGTGHRSDVVSGSLISISLFVCLSASTASLIFLQTEMVGVCKFNPPLVSLSRHSSAVPILLQLNIFSAFLPVSCACPLAALPACMRDLFFTMKRQRYWLQQGEARRTHLWLHYTGEKDAFNHGSVTVLCIGCWQSSSDNMPIQ